MSWQRFIDHVVGVGMAVAVGGIVWDLITTPDHDGPLWPVIGGACLALIGLLAGGLLHLLGKR